MEGKPEAKPCKACAKINLTFEVIGKRSDGYHEIVSVMQAIDLCDVLTVEPRELLYLSCNVPELASPNNLVLKAARLMQSAAGHDQGAAISLVKGIPLAGGLGGGSTDAAVVLKRLNELWRLGLSVEKLTELAAGLGSDVPFFCSGSPTALAQGRGERVTALPTSMKPGGTPTAADRPSNIVLRRTGSSSASERPKRASELLSVGCPRRERIA